MSGTKIGSFLEVVKQGMEDNIYNFTVDGKSSSCGGCCTNLLPMSNKEIEVVKKYIGPVTITIETFFSVPKSDNKKKQKEKLENKILPTKKPDWDNIGKVICDSLNGVAYKDDSQITEATVIKRYSETPRVVVTLVGEIENGDKTNNT